VVPAHLLVDTLQNIYRVLPWSSGAEVTVEANPGTVDLDTLACLRSGGANRLSLGVQSFDDSLLAVMGRAHGAEQAAMAFRQARQVGFLNINIDLMYALPGQTMVVWLDTLYRAVSLEPDHLSLYGLKIEPGTPWGHAVATGEVAEPDQDVAGEMYLTAREVLTGAGYEQYEISNFALPGRQCHHNKLYWQRKDYLGLGVAAASHRCNRRWTNSQDLHAYLQDILAGRVPMAEQELLSSHEAMAENMWLGLRMLQGVDLGAFAARYGRRVEEVFGEAVEGLLDRGLLAMAGGHLRLTARALPVANEVFVHFLGP